MLIKLVLVHYLPTIPKNALGTLKNAIIKSLLVTLRALKNAIMKSLLVRCTFRQNQVEPKQKNIRLKVI